METPVGPLVKETIKIRRDQQQRLRFLQKAMEERYGEYTMDDLYRHIIDIFLQEELGDK